MSEPKIVNPVTFIPPAIQDAGPAMDDQEAARFVEDNTVDTDLTFSQYMAQRRPIPTVEMITPDANALAADVPTDD